MTRRGDIRFGAQKVQTGTKFLAMEIVHHRFNPVANGVAHDNVFDMVEKICDRIDIVKRLLMMINTSNQVIRNDDELKRAIVQFSVADLVSTRLLQAAVSLILFECVEGRARSIERPIGVDSRS